jgi:GT2 family glycosyltransferase
VVLDNQSTEGDVEWISRHHSDVRCIVAPQNDYLFSYNWLLARLEDDIVVLLNNDLRVHEDFLSPLLRHFQAPDVFAVSSSSRDWEDTRFTCGPTRLKSHHGVYEWDFDRGRQELRHTFFCSGGFVALDRKKFLELGGFNRLFWPAYGEDLDMFFRAWRRGWRCIFEPASIVYHLEGSSFGGQEHYRTKKLIWRCQWLFQWSSLPPATHWWERAAMQGVAAFRFLRKGDYEWILVRVKTWFEWLRVRRKYRWMKASPGELRKILDKIESPVVVPPNDFPIR